LLELPRLYLETDTDPIANRGGRHDICGDGTLTLVNPAPHRVHRELEVKFFQRLSPARRGEVVIGPRHVPIRAHFAPSVVGVDLRPGTTTIRISIQPFGARCGAAPLSALPTVSARLRPVPLGP